MHWKEKRFFNFLVFLIFLMCFIGVTEIAMRILFKEALGIGDERSLLYGYDEKLGWFPIKNSGVTFKGGFRSIEVQHNSRGFRDSEHIVDNRPRIVFLGDSLVWGYDVEKQERFTEKLAAKFANLSIYNLGVSGYGTDQEYLLLAEQYDFYHPNIVFLVFCCGNDEEDNSHNNSNDGYFKPYFTANGNSLTLQGVPVPKSWRYFLTQHDVLSDSCWFRFLSKSYFKYRGPTSLEIDNPTYAIITNINKFVRTRGAKFIIGIHGVNPTLKKYLKDNGIPCIDLTNLYLYPSHGRHWTPDGHTFVSEKIYDFLMQEGYLEEVTATKEALHMNAVAAALRPHR